MIKFLSFFKKNDFKMIEDPTNNEIVVEIRLTLKEVKIILIALESTANRIIRFLPREVEPHLKKEARELKNDLLDLKVFFDNVLRLKE